jgi:hypothetical protein
MFSTQLSSMFRLFFYFFLCIIEVNYVGATTQPTIQPTVLMGTAFIPDSHPRSLQASVVTKIDGTLTYRLSCPTGTSPENIACRGENRYPALATHSPGSVFAGAFTTASSGITTRWDCALGSGSEATILDQDGVCNRTIVDGGRTSLTSTAMNSCFVAQHQVPITYTAGLEFLDVDQFGLQDGETLASNMDEEIRKVCTGYTLSTSATEATNGTVITATSSSARGGITETSTLASTDSAALPTSLGAAPTNTAMKNMAFQMNTASLLVTVLVGVVTSHLA